MNTALEQGEYLPLIPRALTAVTLRLFDYRLAGKHHFATFYDKKGRPIAQKRRDAAKNFMWLGSPDEAVLFGQQLWQQGGKKVVVTEGEIDAMSMSQVQNNRWPVVSIRNGAQGAAKCVRRSLEWLSSFEQVIFMFDSDAPGTDAALECAALLSPGRAAIATLPLKDANAMLVAGQAEKLVDAMWRAKTFRPDGIIASSELWDLLQVPDPVKEASYPYTELDRNISGLRRSEVLTVVAGTGVGKSTFMRELAFALIQQGNKIGYIALEETVKHTARSMMSIYLDRPLHLEPLAGDDPRLREAYDATLRDDQVFFYDHWGCAASKELVSKMRFMAVSEGCKYVVLDHISIMVAGENASGDNERVMLDKAMVAFGALAREVNIGVLLVCHLRKADGKPFEEGGHISLNHLRGTAGIAQASSVVIALERNQQSGDDNIATVRVLKDRFTGFTGLAGELEYNKKTGRLKDVDPFDRQERAEEVAKNDEF